MLRGQDLCSAVGADNGILKPASLPLDTYKALRDQPGKACDIPFRAGAIWRAYYSAEFTLGCTYLGKCDGTPQRVGGQYSNIDNSYVTAEVNRGFGEVLVLRGELPRTPKTTGGAKNLDSAVDMRFWSMCSNESLATTKVATCLFDEQMATDADGRYTIVASLPEDRPANATKECGGVMAFALRRPVTAQASRRFPLDHAEHAAGQGLQPRCTRYQDARRREGRDGRVFAGRAIYVQARVRGQWLREVTRLYA